MAARSHAERSALGVPHLSPLELLRGGDSIRSACAASVGEAFFFLFGKGIGQKRSEVQCRRSAKPIQGQKGSLSLSLSLPFQKKGLEWKRAIFWMADTPRQVKQQEFPDSFDKNNCPAGDSLELGPGAYACL